MTVSFFMGVVQRARAGACDRTDGSALAASGNRTDRRTSGSAHAHALQRLHMPSVAHMSVIPRTRNPLLSCQCQRRGGRCTQQSDTHHSAQQPFPHKHLPGFANCKRAAKPYPREFGASAAGAPQGGPHAEESQPAAGPGQERKVHFLTLPADCTQCFRKTISTPPTTVRPGIGTPRISWYDVLARFENCRNG